MFVVCQNNFYTYILILLYQIFRFRSVYYYLNLILIPKHNVADSIFDVRICNIALIVIHK